MYEKTTNRGNRILTFCALFIVALSITFVNISCTSTEGRVEDLLKMSEAEAISGLAKLGEDAVEPLISELSSESQIFKKKAVMALGLIGDPRAVDPLIGLLNDDQQDVRNEAITALGKIGDARAADPIVSAYYEVKNTESIDPVVAFLEGKSKDYDFEMRVMRTLNQLDSHKAIEVALEVGCIGTMGSENLEILSFARNIIAGADSQDATTLINHLLPCENTETQTHMIDLISSLGMGEAASEALISAAKNNGEDSRKAVIVIGKLKNQGAVEPLINWLNDDDLWSYAVTALGEIGDPRAVEPLIGLLAGEDYVDTSGHVARVLNSFDDSDLHPLLDALRDWDLQTIASAYTFYIIRGQPGTEPQLIEALMLYGDETMAEAYKLCGHEPLMDASDDWVKERGKQWWIVGNPQGIQWGG